MGSTDAADWLFPRVLELTYTAWDLAPFAVDCGYDGPPFRWDDARRFSAPLRAGRRFFHLYGINRDDADYILDTFPVVRKKDEAAHGEYRTKRVILRFTTSWPRRSNRCSVPNALDPPPGPPDEPLPEWPAPCAPGPAIGPSTFIRRETLEPPKETFHVGNGSLYRTTLVANWNLGKAEPWNQWVVSQFQFEIPEIFLDFAAAPGQYLRHAKPLKQAQAYPSA